ncbi:MAG: pirin family protein [Pseudomonadales bacterium]|nr:pirin family protein [Pseudomonadales bacterium]NRA16200.1 pirin family protein [Oceanospirillaceae bacterium]
MQLLSKNSIQQGGFAGLLEHRLVTDSRIFGSNKKPDTFEGLGNFVYLADAQFNPRGETGMHPHKEIDVISVMIEGRVNHQGSLEHGKGLSAGDVQVQRAGAEGFSHNEINPDQHKNRMIQLWVLPQKSGESAGYKHYSPKAQGITRIYGGDNNQSDTFDSPTRIHIVNLAPGESIRFPTEQLSYITRGEAQFNEQQQSLRASDGDLIRSQQLSVTAHTFTSMIVIS